MVLLGGRLRLALALLVLAQLAFFETARPGWGGVDVFADRQSSVRSAPEQCIRNRLPLVLRFVVDAASLDRRLLVVVVLGGCPCEGRLQHRGWVAGWLAGWGWLGLVLLVALAGARAGWLTHIILE